VNIVFLVDESPTAARAPHAGPDRAAASRSEVA